LETTPAYDRTGMSVLEMKDLRMFFLDSKSQRSGNQRKKEKAVAKRKLISKQMLECFQDKSLNTSDYVADVED
jgi:hypothetical protein